MTNEMEQPVLSGSASLNMTLCSMAIVINGIVLESASTSTSTSFRSHGNFHSLDST